MKFTKVSYRNLEARQKEIYNFQKVAGLLADYGFNCIKLSDDWKGADFLACHTGGKTLKVQLKARMTIDKKYKDKSLWVTFPEGGNWYLMKHADLVKMVQKHTKWLSSKSWRKAGGRFSSARSNDAVVDSIRKWMVGKV